MSGNLAIYSPVVGATSETFIRRQVTELLPERTVLMAERVVVEAGGAWNTPGPLLTMVDVQKQLHGGGLPRQIVQAIGRRCGWRPPAPADVVKRFLEKHQVQVLLGQYLDSSLQWLDVCSQLGIRFFAHAHGFDVSARLREPVWRERYRRYNEAAGVITMSQLSRSRLIDLGIAPDQVHVVPYGVDVPTTPPTHPPRDTVRCVAVGRMVSKKAPILLLDAFRRALEQAPQLRLDYVGQGDLFPAAEQFVSTFQLGDRVTLHGGRPNQEVRRLMQEADLFIQHSMVDPASGDEEGLPVAVLEAMAHGLPVIATRHAGIPESVTEGVTGFLVDERDVSGMADHIAALAGDPRQRLAMGHAGWQRAREQFSWERERQGLLRALQLSHSA